MRQLTASLGILILVSCRSTEQTGSDLKVVGGDPTAEGDYSSVLQIGSCSVVRISEMSYLTAGHCLITNRWRVGQKLTAKLIYRHRRAKTAKGTLSAVTKHPNEDIALLSIDFKQPDFTIASIYKGQPTPTVAITGYGCKEIYVKRGQAVPGRSAGYLQSIEAVPFVEESSGFEHSDYVYVKAEGSIVGDKTHIEGPSLCPGDSGGGLFAVGALGEPELWAINKGIDLNSLVSTFTRIDPAAGNGVYAWIESNRTPD